MKKKISFILPIYNEQENIPILHQKIVTEMTLLDAHYDYELIFIDDGSNDNSWHIINHLCKKNSAVRALNFTRNFGQQMGLTAGYDYAQGDACITLDSDMQDPPEIIPQLIEKWQEEYDIVYARRAKRHDSFLKKYTALLYFKLLERVADIGIPANVGDYRLIDKKVLLVVRQCREKSRYMRGIIAWTGFKQAFVEFTRPERTAGKSAYNWSKLFKVALDGVTGFSLFPLRIAAYAGVFVIITGLLMFLYITCDALIFHAHYPLFKWLVTIIYMATGMQFLLLWLLGEYLGRVFEHQKNRPLYIIDQIVNFSPKKEKHFHLKKQNYHSHNANYDGIHNEY